MRICDLRFTIYALLAAGLGAARGADITPGYTFMALEQNVDHIKLNLLGAGTINTTFYSGKSSAGANPTTTWEVLLRDVSSDAFKRTTISAGFLDHSGLLIGRTAKAAPVGADSIMISDSAAGDAYKRSYVSNVLYGGTFFSGTLALEDLIPLYDSSAGTMHKLSLSNLIATATELTGASSVTGDEEFLILDSSRNLRRVKLERTVLGAAVLSSLSGSEVVPLSTGADYRFAGLASWFNGGTEVTAPAATDNFGFVDNGGILQKATWRAIRSNAAPAYVLVRSEQASGTSEGLTNVWSARKLNTKVQDMFSLASLSGNLVTLGTGIWEYRVSAPGRQVGAHQVMLSNATAGLVVNLGTTEFSATTDATTTRSFVSGRLTNTASVAYGVNHRCTTSNTSDGGGAAASFGTEVYTVAEFWLIAP